MTISKGVIYVIDILRDELSLMLLGGGRLYRSIARGMREERRILAHLLSLSCHDTHTHRE